MQNAPRVRSPQFRTRVGNGKTIFLTNRDVAHTIKGRRFAELYHQGVSDLGGDLSMAQDAILQMAVTLTVECQMAQVRLVSDEPFDAVKFSTNANAARRLYETLGIKRTPRDITDGSLDDYLASKANEAPAHPLATDVMDDDEGPDTDTFDPGEADNSAERAE